MGYQLKIQCYIQEYLRAKYPNKKKRKIKNTIKYYSKNDTEFKRNKETFFILMFILCTFMPYMFIGRAMFMYHYFPTLPFVMLAIVALMKAITEKIKTDTVYIFYTLLIIVVFFVFYPITSGIVTTNEYIDALKWLSSWVF